MQASDQLRSPVWLKISLYGTSRSPYNKDILGSTTLFASERYDHVDLISRRAEQLEVEKRTIIETVGSHMKIKTFAVDVTHVDALNKALDAVDSEFGKPESIFYNAARVLPSQLLSHDVKEIEYDQKVFKSSYIINSMRRESERGRYED